MNKKISVAVFTYNRPEHTQRTLDALSKCWRIEDCEFHFFSDGPRVSADCVAVNATRKVIHSWAFHFGATVVERPQNFGLAKSIVSGVSSLCELYGRVIVLEDDLVVSPDFLHFMIESLVRYENEEQVMQIGGFTIAPPSGLTADAFFLPVTTTWGWATWQRAWKKFSWDPLELEEAKLDSEWRRRFDLNDTCAFSSMLEDRITGKNDSWGILWWYAVSRLHGLVVYPAKSLVWNGGFDGSGVHCGRGDFLQQGQASRYLQAGLPPSLLFPSVTEYSSDHLLQLEAFFRQRQTDSQSELTGAMFKTQLKSLVEKVKEKFHHAIF